MKRTFVSARLKQEARMCLRLYQFIPMKYIRLLRLWAASTTGMNSGGTEYSVNILFPPLSASPLQALWSSSIAVSWVTPICLCWRQRESVQEKMLSSNSSSEICLKPEGFSWVRTSTGSPLPLQICACMQFLLSVLFTPIRWEGSIFTITFLLVMFLFLRKIIASSLETGTFDTNTYELLVVRCGILLVKREGSLLLRKSRTGWDCRDTQKPIFLRDSLNIIFIIKLRFLQFQEKKIRLEGNPCFLLDEGISQDEGR